MEAEFGEGGTWWEPDFGESRILALADFGGRNLVGAPGGGIWWEVEFGKVEFGERA